MLHRKYKGTTGGKKEQTDVSASQRKGIRMFFIAFICEVGNSSLLLKRHLRR